MLYSFLFVLFFVFFTSYCVGDDVINEKKKDNSCVCHEFVSFPKANRERGGKRVPSLFLASSPRRRLGTGGG